MASHHFPKVWSWADVIAILKLNKLADDHKSYHPISLLVQENIRKHAIESTQFFFCGCIFNIFEDLDLELELCYPDTLGHFRRFANLA